MCKKRLNKTQVPYSRPNNILVLYTTTPDPIPTRVVGPLFLSWVIYEKLGCQGREEGRDGQGSQRTRVGI